MPFRRYRTCRSQDYSVRVAQDQLAELSEPAKWLRGRSDEEAIIGGVLWQLLAGVSMMERLQAGDHTAPASEIEPKYPAEE